MLLLLVMMMELLLVVMMRRVRVLVLLVLLLRARPDVHLAIGHHGRSRCGTRATPAAPARYDQLRFATVLRLVSAAQTEPVMSLFFF